MIKIAQGVLIIFIIFTLVFAVANIKEAQKQTIEIIDPLNKACENFDGWDSSTENVPDGSPFLIIITSDDLKEYGEFWCIHTEKVVPETMPEWAK